MTDEEYLTLKAAIVADDSTTALEALARIEAKMEARDHFHSTANMVPDDAALIAAGIGSCSSQACVNAYAALTRMRERAQEREAEVVRLRGLVGDADGYLAEIAAHFSCHNPPDDGSEDPCDGEDCLKCFAGMLHARLTAEAKPEAPKVVASDEAAWPLVERLTGVIDALSPCPCTELREKFGRQG